MFTLNHLFHMTCPKLTAICRHRSDRLSFLIRYFGILVALAAGRDRIGEIEGVSPFNRPFSPNLPHFQSPRDQPPCDMCRKATRVTSLVSLVGYTYATKEGPGWVIELWDNHDAGTRERGIHSPNGSIYPTRLIHKMKT